MKGNEEVVAVLNEVLSAELTAVNQYFIHGMMCANWGYAKLAAHGKHESIDEMKHAQEVIERILYLDGRPNMDKYLKISVGASVPQQHEFDLSLEVAAIERLNRGVDLCREKRDNGTRALLERILVEEEQHADWLEAQIQQIQDIGLQNYLAQQLEAGAAPPA
jgi:bacterioferritin